MRGRAIIPLVVGLGVGIFAIKLFVDVLQKAKGDTSATVPVIFAATDIDPTISINETMVEIQQVPASLAPDMVFADKEKVVGRVASRSIAKGMPIVPNLLAPPGTPPGMAVRIHEGYRAVAVKIDESAGVAGWIKSGSRVDVVVMLNIRRDNRRSETISKVLLQNVEVLAVGQDIGADGDTSAALAKSVTLLIEPKDVPKLHLAATQGKLRLAMRNSHDKGLPQSEITTDNDLVNNVPTQGYGRENHEGSSFLAALFGNKNKPAEEQTDKDQQVKAEPLPPQPVVTVASAPEPEPWAVEILKGTEEPKVLWFDADNRKARRIDGPRQKAQSFAPQPVRPISNLPDAPPAVPDVDRVPDVTFSDPTEDQAPQTETE